MLQIEEPKLLLVGQAPSRTGDPTAVLQGRSGIWLADLMGVSLSEYLERTDRINLFDGWTGRSGKGDAWDAAAARERASAMVPGLSGRRVIFVGRNVTTAFGLPRLPWMTWTDAFGAKVSVTPHPSGIVRWWNDEVNRNAASSFLRTAALGVMR
jgi:uracil-DNA glycosylase